MTKRQLAECYYYYYYYYYFKPTSTELQASKTRLDIQNYGCNGNLLCYRNVVERKRICYAIRVGYYTGGRAWLTERSRELILETRGSILERTICDT